MTSIILALVIGAAFGAVLDRVGASNPSYIGKMLNLTNLNSSIFDIYIVIWSLLLEAFD